MPSQLLVDRTPISQPDSYSRKFISHDEADFAHEGEEPPKTRFSKKLGGGEPLNVDLPWDVEAEGGRLERATDGVRLQADSWKDHAYLCYGSLEEGLEVL